MAPPSKAQKLKGFLCGGRSLRGWGLPQLVGGILSAEKETAGGKGAVAEGFWGQSTGDGLLQPMAPVGAWGWTGSRSHPLVTATVSQAAAHSPSQML